MAEFMTLDAAVERIKDGMTIMTGGFMGVGAPLAVLDKIVEKGIKDLTLINTGCSYLGRGNDIGKLFEHRLVKKMITSHIGTNPEVIRQCVAGEITVEFYPMGTLIEKIRCGGGGLGGILTPTGVGTVAEEGKMKLAIDGREYLVETALRADVAIIKGHKADRMGNITYRRTAMNSNPIMAMAADYVIAEVDEIVEAGEIDPDAVRTPGIFVDCVVQGYGYEQRQEIYRTLWLKSGKLG